ncbi:MAG: anhydro-N-acetylmuramic acid kinase [Chloroflexota bacterium]|nr:MAG: anhydro-N-acetylmuramic acid kinase [Chloroflexota bacterium]
MRPFTVVGLISGTSADGIDVALTRISGAPPELAIELIRHQTVAYGPELRAEIFACFRPESSSVDRLCRLNVALGEAYADAILKVIAEAGYTPEHVDLIGSHGQTLWYDPPQNGARGAHLALGDLSTIAERTGITTIGNFRARDLAAGGHGAPLVSYMDWLLFRHPTRWRAIQNMGGIGNVTALPPLSDAHSAPLTFDTGPGNMIIDYCAERTTNGALHCDLDGQIAARGKVHSELLFGLLAHPYLHQPPPKATGREVFGAQFGAQLWARAEQLGVPPEDIVATATAFTAQSIVQAYRDWLPCAPQEIYVAGGGAKNPTLLAMLQAGFIHAQVQPHEALGVPSLAKEAMLFALLAYETWHGRSGVLPALTGARHPVPLGEIAIGRLWQTA